MPPSAEPPGRGELLSGRRTAARRERAAKLGAPHLVPILLVVIAALLGWRYWDRIVARDLPIAAASPEVQIRQALAQQDRARLADVYGFRAGGTAELHGVSFQEPVVALEGERARVIARVAARGRVVWRSEAAEVAYLGREEFTMTPCTIALWCGDGQQFSQLRAVLLTLFRRHDAFNGRDAAAYERLVSPRYEGREALLARIADDLAAGPAARVSIRGWQIRVERGRAEVGEDYELALEGREPARLRARYVLVREGDRWLIADGL